ncbi:flavonol synthase/flavanone 3-hydroxylase [Atractiella rhizophila]|nr:flavonol synthase/flavanone 3-hydroxylase [Atractiella rhizophila]
MSSSPLDLAIVDFADFEGGGAERRSAIASSLIQAMRNVGFVYIRNLPIVGAAEVEEMFSMSKKFFNSPLETKMLAPHPSNGAHHRGYSGIGREKVVNGLQDEESVQAARVKAMDWKESFEFGSDTNVDQPNIVPPEEKVPGFKAQCAKFYALCEAASQIIMQAIAIGLGAREDFFLPYHANSGHQLRLLHYPSIPSSNLLSGKAERISAHSDYDTFTLLWQDDVGGLEIEEHAKPGAGSGTGSFRPVPPIKGTCVLNTGDFLMRWSNDYLKSTIHRVRAPPEALEGQMTKERWSIPFFVGSNFDMPVKTIESCITPDQPDRYPEPITPREYVISRLTSSY